MSAWFLAALLCAPASAQVIETGGAAAPVSPVSGAAGSALGAGASISPVAPVPGASSLAPSLNSAALKAFPDRAATGLPAGAVRLAPAALPALPAAAAASAAPAAPSDRRGDSASKTGAAPARPELIPPSAVAGATALRAVAADRPRGSEADASPAGAAAHLDARDAGALDRASAESAAALGRRVFDRAGDRALLADGSAPGAPGAGSAAGGEASPARRDPLLSAASGGSVEGEALRDAVASPIPAAAAAGPASLSYFRLPGSLFAPPAAAPAAAPEPSALIRFERLSLELGSGLVVKVRAALGFAPPGAKTPLDGAAKLRRAAAAPSRRTRAPITSTEWLERRGLLESISASEAAATQAAGASSAASFEMGLPAASVPAPAPRSAAVLAFVLDPAKPSAVPPFAWWALALLPAGLVLLKEIL